jgi:hypothetical protein
VSGKRLVSIALLLSLTLIAFLVPYDYSAHCTKFGVLDLSFCLSRKTALTIFRAALLVLGFLLLVIPNRGKW